jgi:hypothetical protein
MLIVTIIVVAWGLAALPICGLCAMAARGDREMRGRGDEGLPRMGREAWRRRPELSAGRSARLREHRVAEHVPARTDLVDRHLAHIALVEERLRAERP